MKSNAFETISIASNDDLPVQNTNYIKNKNIGVKRDHAFITG